MSLQRISRAAGRVLCRSSASATRDWAAWIWISACAFGTQEEVKAVQVAFRPPVVACNEFFVAQSLPRMSVFGANVHTVCLSGSRNLKSTQALKIIPLLRRLFAVDCPALTNVAAGESLKELDVRRCPGLTNLNGLAGGPQLRSVAVSGCSALADWSFLIRCPSLQRLEMAGTAWRDSHLGALSHCPRIRHLDASRLDGLCRITGAKNTDFWLSKLEWVSLTDSPNLTSILPLLWCQQLRHVEVSPSLMQSVPRGSTLFKAWSLCVEPDPPLLTKALASHYLFPEDTRASSAEDSRGASLGRAARCFKTASWLACALFWPCREARRRRAGVRFARAYSRVKADIDSAL